MKGVYRKILSAISALALLVSGFGCGEKNADLTVYMPDGAPALALAKLMSEDTADDGVSYQVVNPTLIQTKVTYKNEAENADFCVLPVTAASKLLGEGERYQMLGTVTHGNLYFLSKSGERIEDLSVLKGKSVGVLQINQVPGMTFKALLKKKGIPYVEMTNEGGMVENTVNLHAISGADAVGKPYGSEGGSRVDDYYLIAEPAATAQAKNGYEIVGDFQTLYGGQKGYPQAVLVGKKSVVESRKKWTAEFVGRIENSGEWLAAASGETLVNVVSARMPEGTATSLKAPTLSAEVVARCGIYFTYAKDTTTEIEEFLRDLIAVNEKAAAIPAASFYWKA